MRNVTHCSCECPAGAGSKCKHIAALIYYINNEETISKTNLEQEWGKPSKLGEAKYKKGKTIKDLFPKKTQQISINENNSISSISYKSLVSDYNILKIPCILSKMIEKESQSEIHIECEKCVQDVINRVEKSLDGEFINIIISKQIKYDKLLSTIGSHFPLNFNQYEYYVKNIFVDPKQIMNIFNETKMQSQSVQWKDVRKCRISASVKAHRIKTCRNLSFENQKKLAESLMVEKEMGHQGKINVAYGNKYESEAIEFYSQLFCNSIILKCGVVIHFKVPWLCASPDGIVMENGVLTKILEVKCPISCQNKKIYDPENKKCNVPYLEYKNNQIFLKTNHQYYTQCQILMYCTGLSQCDLLVYNKINPIIIKIEKNDLYLQILLTRLHYFYFNFFLPKMIK